MIFNRKFLHSIEAVLDICIYSSHSPVHAKEITKRQGIPSRYLEKILQELVRKKILKGIRGPNGGYTLGKEKRNIFLIDIYNAIIVIEENKKKKSIFIFFNRKKNQIFFEKAKNFVEIHRF